MTHPGKTFEVTPIETMKFQNNEAVETVEASQLRSRMTPAKT